MGGMNIDPNEIFNMFLGKERGGRGGFSGFPGFSSSSNGGNVFSFRFG
jgi:hypothetical protein